MDLVKTVKRSFAVLPVVVLGCVSNVILEPEHPAQKATQQRQTMLADFSKMESCCKTLSELDYREFPDELGWHFSIDATDMAFQFDTGLSVIKAYRLPEKKATYKFTLRTYSLCGKKIECETNSTHMFIPVMSFLDSSFTPVFSLLPGDLMLSTPAQLSQEPQAYEFNVKIETNNQAKFLIIFTTPSLIKDNVEYSYIHAPSVYSTRGESITGLPFGDFKVSIGQYP